MFEIREFSADDIEYALALTNLVGWGYSKKDFRWMMDFEPKGCFIAIKDNERVGITTTITYEKLGWIGNVIVSPKFRRKGIAAKLVNHALEHLKSREIGFIGLYSYLETSNLYRNLGFKEDECFTELCGIGSSFGVKDVRSIHSGDLNKIEEYDSNCFGFNRKKVLSRIFNDFKDLCYLMVPDNEILGYIMGTKSNDEVEIGPWIVNPKYDGELELLKAILNRERGKKINLGVPTNNSELIDKLKKMNFEKNFDVIRMFYKGIRPTMKDNFILAIESLERG
ncbi:MAG: GNAT family N-acetyltransferase [Candidatus Bathyarchaeota archaeon]|nr:GNAT family N-acetyltransferase [Candidatus Bathyarchaeota archaeon]